MTLQEAIEFLEDLQPDVCKNCTMIETCNNAGTGICVEALNIIKAEAQRATYLQAKIDSGVLKRLKAENAKLRELVGLAHADLESAAECETCADFQDCKYNHEYRMETTENNYRVFCLHCYQWQHTDKLNELTNGKDGV